MYFSYRKYLIYYHIFDLFDLFFTLYIIIYYTYTYISLYILFIIYFTFSSSLSISARLLLFYLLQISFPSVSFISLSLFSFSIHNFLLILPSFVSNNIVIFFKDFLSYIVWICSNVQVLRLLASMQIQTTQKIFKNNILK